MWAQDGNGKVGGSVEHSLQQQRGREANPLVEVSEGVLGGGRKMYKRNATEEAASAGISPANQ